MKQISKFLKIVILIVLCYGIARAFNRSRAIQAVALDISKAFDRV